MQTKAKRCLARSGELTVETNMEWVAQIVKDREENWDSRRDFEHLKVFLPPEISILLKVLEKKPYYIAWKVKCVIWTW